jgi:DNA-binding MarR family transcriptional regulator
MEEMISRDIEHYAWWLIGRARHIMLKARQKELDPYEISPQQAHIIDALYYFGDKATLNQLAKDLDRGAASVSALLSRLEKDGIVKKSRENRKSVLKKFDLTEKGINIQKITSQRVSVQKIMSVLSEEQLQQLILMLQIIISSSEKYLVS